MTDEIYCPECGTFVQTVTEDEELGLECGVCGYVFDYVGGQDEDCRDSESELDDLDFGEEE